MILGYDSFSGGGIHKSPASTSKLGMFSGQITIKSHLFSLVQSCLYWQNQTFIQEIALFDGEFQSSMFCCSQVIQNPPLTDVLPINHPFLAVFPYWTFHLWLIFLRKTPRSLGKNHHSWHRSRVRWQWWSMCPGSADTSRPRASLTLVAGLGESVQKR